MRLIINADDFGRSKIINEAISQCFRNGVIQRTTIMVNMPYFNDAIEISKQEGFFDKVGLHLNLDDGEPLTDEIKANSHFCEDGYFRDRIFLNPKYRFYLNSYDQKCVSCEINAQMKRYLEAGFTLRHFDSHHFVHNNLSVLFLVCREARRMGFKSARIMEIRTHDTLIKTCYKKILNSYIRRNFITTGQFIQRLDNFDVKRGSVEFMVHPVVKDSELLNLVSWNPDRYERFDEYGEVLSRIKNI